MGCFCMGKFDHEYWDSYYSQVATMEKDQYDGWLKKYSSILSKCEKVLDLGCGTGINIPAILEYCQSVYAADYSFPALKLVKEEYVGKPVTTFCFDMRKKFPFTDDCFDVVIADLALHYFNSKETRDILLEVKRVLKKGGMLIARVHSMHNVIKDGAIATNESGLYIVDGYQRKYFTCAEIRKNLADWKIQTLEKQTICRYSQEKHVIEFVSTAP